MLYHIGYTLVQYCLYQIGDMVSTCISRLNSGNRNEYNFFVFAIFIFQKSENDSVNHADSGDIKILVQLPGSSILKF